MPHQQRDVVAPLAQRLKAYIGYARSIPRIAADIRANLKTPLPESFITRGIDGFGGFASFYRQDVAKVFASVADPQAQARWWAGVYGVGVTENDGWSTVEGVPGMPILTMDFVPVPEPKTVKNRIHWDVTVPGVAPLVEAGATVLCEPDAEISWHVLADPEGNEFCAFTQ